MEWSNAEGIEGGIMAPLPQICSPDMPTNLGAHCPLNGSDVTRRGLALKSLTSYSPSLLLKRSVRPTPPRTMTFQNRSRNSHYGVHAFPNSDSVELEFRRALVATQRAATWLYEDAARRSAVQEVPFTICDDDGYTADTEDEGTLHHPRRRVLIS